MAAITSAVVGTAIAAKGARDAKKASKRAAKEQARAADASQREIARQFDITQQNLKPFREAGVEALERQKILLGLSGEQAQQEAFSRLQESPGQRFIRQRQERSILRNASATGGLGGGNVLTALQEQAAGFAAQDIDRQFGRLGQLAGQGQSATVQTGQFGSTAAGQQAEARQAGAEARASGILGAQQAKSDLISGGLRLAGQFAGGFK